jgi:hypothetical protein
MTITHANLELVAREICDSRNGAGHYDAKGTKRSHWRKLAYADMERAHGLNTLDALMGIFGFKRVTE